MSWIGKISVRPGKARPVLAVLLLLAGAAAVAVAILLLDRNWTGVKVPPTGKDGPAVVSGKQLYTNHCAACHGEKGDGNGPAARFLYPKPRNFGEGKFRLVSTVNRMPTDTDLVRVVTRGMPGSAMVPFGHLSEAERLALVGHVRQLAHEGLLEQYRQEVEKAGEQVALEDLKREAEDYLRPGELLQAATEFPASTSESIARGNALFQVSCAPCHGKTGKGDGSQDQKNDDGMPTRPRDLTRGIFKGSREPDQLVARIVLGLPGSPMPANPNLKPSEINDVIHYVLSLSNPAMQTKVEHRRTQIVTRRFGAPLPADIPASAWDGVPAAGIVVSPLWWRDYPEPDLHVAALHDGETLAVRLTWLDASRNESVARTEDFEDMAALQLFSGKPEPFLGMGADDAHVDLWVWRGSWNRPPSDADNLLDDYPFDAPLYRDLLKGKEKGVPDFRTARAAGNPVVGGEANAAGLAAKGFGSTTFRPKASQRVTAAGVWKDGRWTVVLRRPLEVTANEGVALAAGETRSIAFALWDGEARDRNGQKLISIWHDLKLE